MRRAQRTDVGLHFEVLVWSVARRAVEMARVGSVVYAGGEVAWDKVVSAERRWLFERLEAALAAWAGPGWRALGDVWRLEGWLDEAEAPHYRLSVEGGQGDTPLPSWGALAPEARDASRDALDDVLAHVEALLTIIA